MKKFNVYVAGEYYGKHLQKHLKKLGNKYNGTLTYKIVGLSPLRKLKNQP